MQNFYSDKFDYDECVSRGMCSISPSISALQEVLTIILRQTAYYTLKLKVLDISTEDVVLSILKSLTNSLSNTAYSDSQILGYVYGAYKNLTKIRNTYIEKSKEAGLKHKDIPDLIKLSPDMVLSEIISLGEKVFQNNYKKIAPEKKNYTDLLIMIIKGLSENIITAADYNYLDVNAAEEILSALNMLNLPVISLKRYHTEIEHLITVNEILINHIYELYTQEYGHLNETKVSLSTSKGKSILVSGSNFKDLKNLLDSVKSSEIDVYTHDLLLSAHAFSEFQKYKELKGHYGTCSDKCLLDFATFPGAILITKNSNINTEYIYRGRLFTTSNIQPQGVIQVKNNDYQAIIKSALEAKGFAKGQNRPSETTGTNIEKLENILDRITENIRSGKIRDVILLWNPVTEKIQLEKMLSKLNKNVFVISFSRFKIQRENLLELNLAENRILTAMIISLLLNKIPVNYEHLHFYFAKCNIHTLCGMLYLKINNAQNVYMANCSPNVISPNTQKFIANTYNIKLINDNDKEFEQYFTTE